MTAADDLGRLEELVGRECWSAKAGLDREWLVVLDLGDKVRRSLRLANPTLSFEQRTFEGSHAVVVEGVWRVDGPDGVVVSCLDVRTPTDRLDAGLAELIGRKVESAEANPPAHDLRVRFEGGYVLHAFVLEPLPAPKVSVPEGGPPPKPPRQPQACWTVWTPQGTVMVGPHGKLGDPKVPADPKPNGRRLELVDVD